MWVSWIQSHCIRSRNFWVIKKRNEWSWILRSLLDLRSHCRRFVIYNVGNGLSTHAWEDTWSEFGPLIQLLSYRFINGHGFCNNSMVSDVMQRFGTNWPVDWIQQYPQLQSIIIPSPSQMEDTFRWLDAKLSRGNFEVKVAWQTIQEVRPIVHWYKLLLSLAVFWFVTAAALRSGFVGIPLSIWFAASV
ncbi:uncharacterized protein LOC112502925 [Cynara cardunculus var. scolymus]|uniref:uncharacterized protein LOC112502925 n=1 Tax=Cynara cardunculus var. scolymus TaxID=59895 RepID=UPI000D629149|nr:uncharacterized protein LOC112502925 [Cynara cardunculus var. scolymus]